jgi:hypothetical protein
VAVLIDGDGAKFTSELLQDRDTGGREAARRLNQAVCHYLKETDPELCVDNASVVVNIWANLGGLAKALLHDGSIKTTDQMSEFAEGFSRSRAEFDFVNVGRGKENADNKLRRVFNFYYNNIQCRKIFFAGCHDTGYIHDLEEKREQKSRSGASCCSKLLQQSRNSDSSDFRSPTSTTCFAVNPWTTRRSILARFLLMARLPITCG